MGREGAIPLSNSLSVTEKPRIEYALHHANQGDHKQISDTIPFRHGQLILFVLCSYFLISFGFFFLNSLNANATLPLGQIIVSKAFIGNSTPIRDGQPLDRSSYPTVYSVYRNLDTKRRSAMSEGKVN